MSGVWVGPLLLGILSLGWFAVQRAWVACMERPADSDALARPGQCGWGGDCPRNGDCPHSRSRGGLSRQCDRGDAAPEEQRLRQRNCKEIAS